MHPPAWVLKRLQELHPQVRLGWVGEDRKGPDDDINKGHFALIQLYHSRDASRTYFGDSWNARGPIFGKPFDPLQREPRYLMDVSKGDVCQGRVIEMLKRWMRPMRERFMESAVQKGRDYASQVSDQAGQMGSEMYWRAQQTSATRPEPLAKKFLTKADKKKLSGESEVNLADTYMQLPTNAMPMV